MLSSFSFFLSIILSFLFFIPVIHSSPQTSYEPSDPPTVILEISQANISSDCTTRPSVTINGTTPGPQLRFREGQTVKIRVINRLQDSNTTIHFHGISQYGSPFADGTPKVSQFAIAPRGGHFDYIFYLEPGSAGTYMYHAHVDFQLSSAYAAFIVEDAQPVPFEYDEEVVLMFGDYYHALDHQISQGLEAKPFEWLGEPQSIVVNGNALGSCNSSHPYGCTSNCHHHVLSVKPNKVYRVRVIGITALTYLYFSIQDHSQLDVIEADGGYLKPARTNHMRLHSGQRYSFLLKTKSHAELKSLGSRTDFWGRIESRWRPIRDRGAFVLRYEDESIGQDFLASVSSTFLRDLSRIQLPGLIEWDQLIPLPGDNDGWLTESFEPLDESEIAPRSSEVTRRLTIIAQQRTTSDGAIFWRVNDVAYVETEPTIPFLVKAYATGLKPDYEAAESNNGFDSKIGAYPVKLNDVVEIVFINFPVKAAEAHPWHIHGQKPYVIAQGTGEFDEQVLQIAEAKFNNTHIRRDTQVVFSGAGHSDALADLRSHAGWMVMRMKAQTPGAFLFHCHIQPHAIMGMAGVMLVGVEELPALPKDIQINYYNDSTTPDSSAGKV